MLFRPQIQVLSCYFLPDAVEICPLSLQDGGHHVPGGADGLTAHEEPAAQGAVELEGVELQTLILDDLELLGEAEGADAQGEHGHGGVARRVGNQPLHKGVPEAGAGPVDRLGLVAPVGGEPLLITVRQRVDGGQYVPFEILPLPLGGEGPEQVYSMSMTLI